MKLDKLLKRLKRDLSASPQKAAALGLMVLVALYFWAPLLMKFAGSKSKEKLATSSPVILTENPLLTKVAAHPAADASRWERARQSLAQDQMMVAARHREEWGNPFQRQENPIAAAQTKEPTEPTESIAQAKQRAETLAVDASQAKEQLANLAISTLLIGKRDNAAVILGKVRRVNDFIELGGENGDPALLLRITNIDSSGVDVDLAGMPFRLERAKPKLSPGDHVKLN